MHATRWQYFGLGNRINFPLFCGMKRQLFFLSFLFLGLTTYALEVGDDAPDFSAKQQDGTDWKYADIKGKQHLVVYFYPAAMTGGCTRQACAYRDAEDDLEELNAVVVGISGDKPAGLALFAKQEKLNFDLLADEDGSVAKAFGVPTKDGGTITRTVDGKDHDLVRGVTTARWTFVIDKNGSVVHKSEKVNAAKDSESVLTVLKGLKK